MEEALRTIGPDSSELCDIDLSSIPISALRTKSRTLLSKCLNAIQIIPAESGLPRDYRGIADLFGLDNPLVSTIERSEDPVKIILENVEKEFKDEHTPYSITDLMQHLESIERFDVIDDCLGLFNEDGNFHINKINKLSSKGIKYDSLTISDSSTGKDVYYDAYVCYANEDIEFVSFLSDYLESPRIGLRLFIRDRDLLLGTMKYDAYAKLIEERCKYVIIILTPDFAASEECKYQTLFATDLAIQEKQRKLIPIIRKPCEIPPFVRLVSKIDVSRQDPKWEWIWPKLIHSISSKPIMLPSPPSYPSITYDDVPQKINPLNSHNNQLSKQQNNSVLHNQKTQNDKHLASSLKSATSTLNGDQKLKSKAISSDISISALKALPPVPTSSIINSSESIRLESSSSLLSPKTKKNWLRSLKQKLTGLASSEPSANGYNNLTNSDFDSK